MVGLDFDQIGTMKEEKMSKIASRFLALETEVMTKNTEEQYDHKRRESDLVSKRMDSILDMLSMRGWQHRYMQMVSI